MVEDDLRLVVEDYNSSFITYELETAIYTYKDLSKALLIILQPGYDEFKNSVVIQFDDITMKTNLVLRSGNIAIKVDEKSFFSTILVFKPYWDYKHCNKYISQEIVNLNTTNKIHLKCDVIHGSVVNAKSQSIVFSFVSNKPNGYNVFFEPETIHFKKMNKTVLKTKRLLFRR